MRFRHLNKLFVFILALIGSLFLFSNSTKALTIHSNDGDVLSDLKSSAYDVVRDDNSHEFDVPVMRLVQDKNSEMIGIFFDINTPQAGFAANEIKRALVKNGYQAELLSLDNLYTGYPHRKVVISTVENVHTPDQFFRSTGENLGPIQPQGYAIRTTMTPEPRIAMNTTQQGDILLAMNGTMAWVGDDRTEESEPETYWVFGGDDNGAMYGGVDLAGHIRFHGMTSALNDDQNPYIERRGIKFNITLDDRTPSYDSSGDAADVNIKHMWDMTFWQDYFDEMARHKYNVISFWNRHPFPSLVKLADYPNVALKDVYDNNGRILTMTIDEKIKFWQDVMAYAKGRGFEIYIFNWNLLVHGAQGKHGITESLNNSTTKDYMRKSLYALFETYPDLDGFGLHSGENMGSLDDSEKEVWLYDCFGEAFENFKADYPDRELCFIHRLHETDIEDDIMPQWGKLPYPMDMSYKYTLGHLYAYPKPTFIHSTLPKLAKYNMKTWLNIRNDDIFYYRWGDPDYVRAYMKNVPDPETYLAGYYMGSDGYAWGRVFTSKDPLFQGELEVKKHWYNFMLWGQMGYDPDTPDQYFIDAIANRFTAVPSQDLYNAWRFASKIFPKVSAAFWWDWDFQWYVEGCYSTYGFRTIQDFITTEPQSGAPIYSIKEYKSRLNTGQPMNDETPIQVSEALRAWADSALTLVATIPADEHSELMLTLNDIKAMAYMGYYYADKIEGATYQHVGDLEKSADHLQQAYCHWCKVAEIASSQYYDQELARHGSPDFSWNDLIDDVARDMEIVGGVLAGHCDAQAPPEEPTELTATAINSGTEIELNWTDHSENENFFKIERIEQGNTAYSVIEIVAANQTGYTDVFVKGSTKYIYRVRASNPAGDSEYSNPDTVETAEILSGQLPWVEDFTRLADGTVKDDGKTSWRVNISGLGNISGTFSVQNQMFDICDTDGNGIWTSEKIDISGVSSVDITIKVRSEGGLDAAGSNYDYLKCYINIDDEPDTLIREFAGKIYGNTISGFPVGMQGISGDSLQILFHGSTSYSDEHYYIEHIKVTTATSGIEQEDRKTNSPRGFELKQNYPNPFNNTTRIDYSLSEKSAVRICVYNLNGSLMSKILNDIKNPGHYSINWDASQYSSGTYLIQLKVNDLTTIKKCVFLK